MSDYLILIPTLGRGPARQHTWKQLLNRHRQSAFLVVSPKERPALRDAGLPALSCPLQDGKAGLGAVRQWCLEFPGAHRKLILLDDDLQTWSRRYEAEREDGATVVRHLSGGPAACGAGLDRLLRGLDRFAHGAVRHRLFAQAAPVVEYNARALRAHGYRVDVLRRLGIRFDRQRTMSDFDVTLQLLRAGYANFVDGHVVQEQVTSDDDGGCSRYRTAAEMRRAAKSLAIAHAPWVTVVRRAGVADWFDGAERLDVRVSWAKVAREFNARRLS